MKETQSSKMRRAEQRHGLSVRTWNAMLAEHGSASLKVWVSAIKDRYRPETELLRIPNIGKDSCAQIIKLLRGKKLLPRKPHLHQLLNELANARNSIETITADRDALAAAIRGFAAPGATTPEQRGRSYAEMVGIVNALESKLDGAYALIRELQKNGIAADVETAIEIPVKDTAIEAAAG